MVCYAFGAIPSSRRLAVHLHTARKRHFSRFLPFSDKFFIVFFPMSEIASVVQSFSCIFSENPLQREKPVIILHRKKETKHKQQ
jgi:hypothetical protein